MHTRADVQVWPLDKGFGDEAIAVDLKPAERLTEAEARDWQVLCAGNPSLHNGSIWGVTHVGLKLSKGQACVGEIKLAAEQFARLALAREKMSRDQISENDLSGQGILALGVKCMVLARNRDGHLQVLLAKRGNQANIYPGLWEVAPAGMVEGDVRSVGLETLRRQVQREAMEELGLGMGLEVRWVCVLKDPRACTADFVCVSFQQQHSEDLPVVEHRASGEAEHVDARWANLAERARICQEQADTLSPPTRSLLGWPGLTLLD